MGVILQIREMLLSTIVQETVDKPSFSTIVDWLSNLSDTIQNLKWLLGCVITVIIVIVALFSIRWKANNYTKKQIKQLTQNGKYIPGIFIELNQSKEVLRYFVYGTRWKKRLIKKYNFMYDNYYGNILRDACENASVSFHLNCNTGIGEIKNVVENAINLHEGLRERKEILKADYSESQYLFEIVYYPYKENLNELQKFVSAMAGNYFILTGSAGNGKTNLLCTMGELLIKLNEAVMFINARDIKGDAVIFLLEQLKLPKMFTKFPYLYLSIANWYLKIERRHLFIIIDAINENDDEGFENKIVSFINELFAFERIKIIVSCRNEYYQERYRKYLVEDINTSAYEFDLKDQYYTTAAINRIFRSYSDYFNYSGTISPAVKNVLSKQLLLLRIFFEIKQNSDENVLSIRKHEIFAQYITKIKKESGEDIEKLLNTLADYMLSKRNYDEIGFSELVKTGISDAVIRNIMDGSVLISKKLITHAGTIARREEEVVYFVFDEMRDYYLAKRIVLKYTSADSVDGEAIINHIKELKAEGVSCAEGIIHYIYIFFRTDSVIIEMNQSEKFCNEILCIHQIPAGRGRQSYWHKNHRVELQNLGLRIILTSGLSIVDFEKRYIQDCLKKDSYEDGGAFFDIMLEGTIYNGINDLETYLHILFGMENRKEICNVLKRVIERSVNDEGFVPEDFIKEHKALFGVAPDRALQIQKVAELFMLCFKLNDDDMQNQLIEYFFGLSTHEDIQREMYVKMESIKGTEVNTYE